jgi:tetratricopeptide (TPR) repeat protein/cellulose biosynthesis protein BcsQ
VITTFYSYKGGVGRSMAMANVADLLARRGLKTLMIDFDLEAPGLEKFFQINQEGVRRHPGLLDLLLSYKQSMSVAGGEEPAFRRLDRFICPVYERLPGGGRLDIMPAGQRQGAEQLARYALDLRTFDWQDFYFNWEGELFFEWLRRSLTGDRYDVVLVDSRTGVTEMGGICGYQLPDTIVMMCAANHQNVEGTQNMVRDFRSPSVESLRRGRPLQIVVVPARIEQRDPQLLEAFFQRFDAAFAGLMPAGLDANGLTFRELMIPYEPQYAFEERVVSDPAQAAERKRIGGAFERLADAVALLADPASALGHATTARHAGATAEAPPAAAAPAEAQYDAARRFAGYDVFLDSSGGDRELTEQIWRDLQRRRLQVFYDRTDIPSGEDWESVVEAALFHTRVMLYCIGAQGLSEWRRRTLDIALRAEERGQQLRIVPVLLPGADLAMLRDTALAQTAALDLRTGMDPAALEQVYGAAQPLQRASAVQTEARTPFVGQNPYGEEQSDLFFGRDTEADALAARVESSSCIALVGPSGAGKTSLVMAGAVPRLRKSASGPWTVVTLRPGDRPLEQLAESLAQARTRGGAAARLLLFVNKLEEVYTESASAAERDAFLDRLAHLPGELGAGACLMLVVRSDYLERFESHAPVAALLRDNRMDLEPMSEEALRRAIEGPAEKVGLAFEPGLVERIVGDMQTEPNALSLLQHLLARLWEQRREGWLTNAAYDSTDGLRGILAARAEEVYGSLDALQQSAMRSMLLRLVNVGRGGEDTRRRMPIEAIQPAAVSQREDLRTAYDTALEAMLAARLLIATDEQGQRAVQPAHESLIRGWSRLRGWLDEERDTLRWRQTLDAAIGSWVKSGRKNEALLRGTALNEALRRYQAGAGELTVRQTEFILASRKARSAHRLTLLFGLLVLLVIAGVAVRNYIQASEERIRVQNVERAAGLRAEGDALADQGLHDQALARYTDAIALDPHNPEAYFRRGLAFLGANQPAPAEDDFTLAIDLSGEAGASADYYLNRGYARIRLRKLQQALADYGEAVALDRTNRSAWLELGRAHEQLAAASANPQDQGVHLRGAFHAYDEAIKVDAQFAQAYFNRGALLERIPQRRQEAIADFRRVLALPSADQQMKQAAGARLRQLGATAPQASQTARAVRVALHYADPADERAAGSLGASLRRKGYAVDQPEQRYGGAAGQVRFFFPQDEAAAVAIRDQLQTEIAKTGNPVRLGVIYRDAKQFENVQPGTVEVWLPSLSAPLGEAAPPQAVKRY